MPEKPQLEKCDRVLMVEGYGDLLFFAEVLEVLDLHGQVFIKQFNGRHDLATKLETFLTPQILTTKTALGLIVDADSNAQQTAAEFSRLLSGITGQNASHAIWTQGRPRIGLFVNPDGVSNGEIESLVWQTWAADPVNAAPRQCVEHFVECMARAEHRPHSPHKGLISALLAIRNDEDPRLGPGARAKIFNFDRPEFAPLKQFLRGFRT